MTETPDSASSAGDHSEHEDQAWTINIPGHPVRSDSPEYVRSRATLTTMAGQTSGLLYGQGPYEDHHGGGLWLKDAQGWFLVRNLVGMEWSSQFCADPAKVDLVRQNAQRLYAAFPEAAPVGPRGSGDGRVHVLYATPGSALAGQVGQSEAQSEPLILGPGHPLAQQAFRQQNAPAPAAGS